jgi:hypothetical protein
MSIYSIALFVHIVGAVLLFALLTYEGAGLRFGFASANLNRVVGPISLFAILVPGLYMVADGAGWSGWVAVGLVAWVLIAALGTFTGIQVMRGRMAPQVAALSWFLRGGMAFAVVFDMTVKPDGVISAAAVLVGAALGAAGAALAGRRRAAAQTQS